jgi:hypothetical protein
MGRLEHVPPEVLAIITRFLHLVGHEVLRLSGSSTLRNKLQNGGINSLCLNLPRPIGWANMMPTLEVNNSALSRIFKASLTPQNMITLIDIDYHLDSRSWIVSMLQNSLLTLESFKLRFGSALAPLLHSMMESRVVLRESMPRLRSLELTSFDSSNGYENDSPFQYLFGTLPSHLTKLSLYAGPAPYQVNAEAMVCKWPETLKHFDFALVLDTDDGPINFESVFQYLEGVQQEMGDMDRLKLDEEAKPQRPLRCRFPDSMETISIVPPNLFLFDSPITPEIIQNLPRRLTSFTFRSFSSESISSALLPPSLTYLHVEGASIAWQEDTLTHLREMKLSHFPSVSSGNFPSCQKFTLIPCEGVEILDENGKNISSKRAKINLPPIAHLDLLEIADPNKLDTLCDWVLKPRVWEALRVLKLNVSFLVADLPSFPSNLTHLFINQCKIIDSAFLSAIPSSLLLLSLGNVHFVDPDAFLHFLSPNHSDDTDDGFSAKTPPRLTTLSLRSTMRQLSQGDKTHFESLSGSREDEWFEKMINALPSSITSLELDFARPQSWVKYGKYESSPLCISWPPQLQSLHLPSDHLSVEALMHMPCRFLEDIRLACISVGSLKELLKLPLLLASSPFCKMLCFASAPIWIPKQVWEAILEVEENVPNTHFFAPPADSFEDALKSPRLASLQPIMRHLRILGNTFSFPFAQFTKSRISGFSIDESQRRAAAVASQGPSSFEPSEEEDDHLDNFWAPEM